MLTFCAVRTLGDDKKKVSTWRDLITIAFVFPSISFCYKGMISNKKITSEESFSSVSEKLCYEVVMVVKVI